MCVCARRCKKRWLNYIWIVLPRTSVIRPCYPRYLHYCRFLRTRPYFLRVVGFALHISACYVILIALSSACWPPVYCNAVLFITTIIFNTLSLPLPLFFWTYVSVMLSNRLCFGCGRQVCLATIIQSLRCPACRLARLPLVPETRPCLRCYVPIPADLPNVRCMRCEATRSSSHLYSLCYDCQALFPTQPSVMRCIDCRSRRSNVVQRPVEFSHTYGISFDPTINSFQPLNTPISPYQPKRRRTKPLGPSRPISPLVTAESEKQTSVINRAVAFLLL
jgi:hypothetical protein